MMTNTTIDCSNSDEVSKLYVRLRPFALSKTQYLTGDLAVAQDIVQDVFESLMGNPIVFNSDSQAYQWVYKSCHNRGIDFLRNRKRRLSILDVSKSVMFPEPKTPQDRLANQQVLAKLINKFNSRQAEILGFVAIDGLSQVEIAKLLDISTKTVQRELAQIQEILDQHRGYHE